MEEWPLTNQRRGFLLKPDSKKSCDWPVMRSAGVWLDGWIHEEDVLTVPTTHSVLAWFPLQVALGFSLSFRCIKTLNLQLSPHFFGYLTLGPALRHVVSTEWKHLQGTASGT